jgi:hypothetical protein
VWVEVGWVRGFVDVDFEVSFIQFLPLLSVFVLHPALNNITAFVRNDRGIHNIFTFGIIDACKIHA